MHDSQPRWSMFSISNLDHLGSSWIQQCSAQCAAGKKRKRRKNAKRRQCPTDPGCGLYHLAIGFSIPGRSMNQPYDYLSDAMMLLEQFWALDLCPFLLVNPSNPPSLLHIQIHYNLKSLLLEAITHRIHSNPPLLLEVHQNCCRVSPCCGPLKKNMARSVLKHTLLARRLRRTIGLGSALRKG